MTKILTSIALALSALLAASCGHGGVDLPPADTNAAPAPATGPAAPPAKKAETVSIKWGANWKLKVRPAFSGQALPQGTGTVSVEAWDGGPSSVSYEFPKATFGAVPQRVNAESRGAVRLEPASGHITVPQAARAASVFVPPAFWQNGDATAPGPLLWLSPGVVGDLKTTKTATLTTSPLPNGLMMAGTPAPNPGPAKLSFVKPGMYVMEVNGQSVRLPALQLEDDRGCRYTVLDSPENPLVVSFRFGSDAVVAGKKLTNAPGSGYDVVAMDAVEAQK